MAEQKVDVRSLLQAMRRYLDARLAARTGRKTEAETAQVAAEEERFGAALEALIDGRVRAILDRQGDQQ